MALGALGGASERLAWILEANSDNAVAGFRKVGAEAETSLKKADDSSNNMGRGLQVAGAGAVAFAAVAGKALFDFAKAAEESEAADIRLSNSVQNSGGKAGDSVGPYDDLAKAIEHKTAMDDEDVKTGESLLIQFGLTKDQVLGLTPLVVDLARKMGVDMTTASKAVGKAVEGNVGGLQRMGIMVDKTAFASDHFGAVTDALRQKVGGFAEQEGATFSGRMERLGNEFHDLEETLGKGVIDAFSSFADVGEKVIGVFDKLSPGMGENIGKWGTYGVAALGAAGALSFTIGTVERATDRFGKLADWLGRGKTATEASTVATEASTVAQGEGAVAAEAKAVAEGQAAVATEAEGVAAGEAAVANEGLAVAEGEATVAAEGLSIATGVGAVAAVAALAAGIYVASQNAESFSVNLKGTTLTSEDWTKANEDGKTALDAVLASSDLTGKSLYDMGKTMAEQSIPSTLGFADALDRQGKSSVDVRRAIADVQAAQLQQKASTDGLTASQEALTQANKDYTDALRAEFDPLFAAIAAEQANTKAKNDATAAATAVYYAQVVYTNAVRDHGPASAEAMAAQDALNKATADASDKNVAAAKSAESFQLAMSDLTTKVQTGDVVLSDAVAQLNQWVQEGLISQQTADTMAWKFGAAAAQAQINGHATLDTSQANAAIDALLAHMQQLKDTGQFLSAGHFATGTPSAPGGPALVGEQGPEMVNLPVGAQVFPAISRESLHPGGGATQIGPNYFQGISAAEVVDELEWSVKVGGLRGAA